MAQLYVPRATAPDFDARLRRGNSLIGARHATYTVEQVKAQPWRIKPNKATIPPTDQPLDSVAWSEAQGIHHFLLPGEGWGAAADSPELKGKGGQIPESGLARQWCERVRAWRTKIHGVPSRLQMDRLMALASRVETAWAVAARDAAEHLRAYNQRIDVWGAETDNHRPPSMASSTRYLDSEGPTSRLRLPMDAWCALWMWAPANGTDPPNLNEWLDAVELLLGQPNALETYSLFTPYELADGTLESVERFGKASVGEVVARHPWLAECQTIARTQGFFHWELDQAGVFLVGGFDIQIGNPPWVRPTWDEPASLAEYDPWWGVTDLTKTGDAIKRARRKQVLANASASLAVAKDRAEIEGVNASAQRNLTRARLTRRTDQLVHGVHDQYLATSCASRGRRLAPPRVSLSRPPGRNASRPRVSTPPTTLAVREQFVPLSRGGSPIRVWCQRIRFAQGSTFLSSCLPS